MTEPTVKSGLLARDEAHAHELILAWAEEYERGISDRRGDAKREAAAHGLDPEWVDKLFEVAGALRPKPKLTKRSFTGAPKADDREALGAAIKESVDLFISPSIQPEAEAKAEEVAKEPEPKAEPERVILSRSSPFDTAKRFAKTHYREGVLATRFYKDQFWTWNGCCYEVLPLAGMIDQIWVFLDKARVGTSDDNRRFLPTPKDVDAVLKALKTAVSLDPKLSPPRWTDSDKSAEEMLIFRNCLVNSTTGEISELTPKLWATSAVDFDFDREARCPRWQRFLEEIFPGDPDAQACVEEQLGYGMTYDTKFEKAALWIGVKRSGKTTLTWVQEQLAGSDSYVSLSFHNWNRSENSRAGLVGKKVAVFADVRLKPSRAFGRSGYDAGGLDHQSAEYLLNITGRDRQSIGRKYKDDWQGPLTAKIIITSNQPPNLQDAGGVLPSRFIKLEFKQSFDGEKQDPNLRTKLTGELPGIANRCLAAYRRLCARGHFIQPASGLELEKEINALVNPYLAFLSDCYFIDAKSGGLTSSNIHDDYLMWCQRNSRFDINHIGYRELMKRLKEVPGEWEKVFCTTPFRPTGNQQRRYCGISRRQAGGLDVPHPIEYRFDPIDPIKSNRNRGSSKDFFSL